jgi:hypothetical protein
LLHGYLKGCSRGASLPAVNVADLIRAGIAARHATGATIQLVAAQLAKLNMKNPLALSQRVFS